MRWVKLLSKCYHVFSAVGPWGAALFKSGGNFTLIIPLLFGFTFSCELQNFSFCPSVRSGGSVDVRYLFRYPRYQIISILTI